MELTIRAEAFKDVAAVREVVRNAFGRDDEADLVDALRGAGHVLTSLIAETSGKVIGHVLFGDLWVVTDTAKVSVVAMAPLAVAPEFQRRGVGTELVRAGLKSCKESGHAAVIVLGEPAYYARFGFSAEKLAGVRSPFPRENFLALELTPGALGGIEGVVLYPPPFGAF